MQNNSQHNSGGVEQNATQAVPSPFHSGEHEIQTRTGKREVMENFGRRAIRPYMPDQHREFFTQLPFMAVGSVDENGWPWASILPGKPGFVQSPDNTTLDISALAIKGDPLAVALKRQGMPLGLIGIELPTRRRNRVNGRVNRVGDNFFSLSVDQSFGNCPQYIQERSVDFIRDPAIVDDSVEVSSFSILDDDAKAMIHAADTFFVSSFIHAQNRPDVEGVDISHRGGRPGFVKVDGNTLTIPDYPGNYYFNTLGNFLLNPKAGLVFTDFNSGDILMLTGRVTLLWEDEEEVKAFKGSERAWRFTLEHGIKLKGGLPFRASLNSYSPNTLLTGNWAETTAIIEGQKKRQQWRPYRLARIEDESSVIRSFYFEPAEGSYLMPFEAGQFLTIKLTAKGQESSVVRTYTVSSAPGESYYRISVKREQDGVVSQHLHDNLKVGDIIEAKAPSGDFYIDPAEERPAVLLAGGVGITPMMSMATHVVKEGILTRHLRPLTIFHSAQTTEQQAFAGAFRTLEQHSSGGIRYFSVINKPKPTEKAGVDFNATGHISADIIKQALPLDDYDFFLCGPPGFMQAMYDILRSLGVADKRIIAEAFGPASLQRQLDEGSAAVSTAAEAQDAIVKFTRSNFEQRWNAGDATLLETAEAHGLNPEFSCRNGACGSCAVKLKAGEVAYRSQPTASYDDDEVLICCAVPAEGTSTVEIDL